MRLIYCHSWTQLVKVYLDSATPGLTLYLLIPLDHSLLVFNLSRTRDSLTLVRVKDWTSNLEDPIYRDTYGSTIVNNSYVIYGPYIWKLHVKGLRRVFWEIPSSIVEIKWCFLWLRASFTEWVKGVTNHRLGSKLWSQKRGLGSEEWKCPVTKG